MKINFKNKTLLFFIKILIVVFAFYFIYNQLANNKQLDWDKFLELVSRKASVFNITLLLLFSIANRFLEIVKWQNLVSTIRRTTIGQATKQVLGALTAGIFTPNGLGEYAGKALYFPKSETKQVIFLNLICNGIQMIITIIGGIIGLYYLQFSREASVLLLVAFSLFLILYLSKKLAIKGYSINKLVENIQKIPKAVHNKNIILALSRYLVFSHQYYFLFLLFDVELPYFQLMATIAAVYFLASSLPSFQFLDFAVKGSVAVFFFGKLGVNEWIVVFISTLMWFLNIVLPVVLGSYYVLTYKPTIDSEEL